MLLSDSDFGRLGEHQYFQRSTSDLLRAAVAIIIRDGEHDGQQQSEFLMMQRSWHKSDPWAGQMAFPGGKVEVDDISALHTAMRETREEVSIDLQANALVTRLDDVHGLKVNNRHQVHVAPFVFRPEQELQPIGNHEVAELLWVPFSALQDNNRLFEHPHPKDPSIMMPAILLDESKQQFIWGLSLRILVILFDILKLPIKALSFDQQTFMLNLEVNINLSKKP